ncbi:alpha/beta hydrolase [Demequina sp. NBRC 110053]|uniref:alpha/beta hydrolase n=1 Tax=Demequina sp. NBRC 110053 TaxID=1570342 RepID=UPI00135657C8|nr:hypothetical protein [Demequina sp. NBRC 110053]
MHALRSPRSAPDRASLTEGQDEPPLVVLLHGFGSHERDLPPIAPYVCDLPWISLRAPLELPGAGAAWFPLDLPHEPRRDDIAEATRRLWEALDGEVGPQRTLVPLGFSQGGLMALQLLRTRPERVAATVMLCGFVAEGSEVADARLSEQRPPVFWGRGAADQVIWPAAIARTASLLPQISTLTERAYDRLGHGVDERMLSDARAFLDAALG